MAQEDAGLLGAVAQVTQMSRPIVEPAFWLTMGFLGTAGPGILEGSLALPGAGLTIPGGGLVIGKMGDLGDLGPGERTLMDRGQMPNQGSDQANVAQNAGRLRFEMGKCEPIRDASAADPNSNTGYLRMERNILENQGGHCKAMGIGTHQESRRSHAKYRARARTGEARI